MANKFVFFKTSQKPAHFGATGELFRRFSIDADHRKQPPVQGGTVEHSFSFGAVSSPPHWLYTSVPVTCRALVLVGLPRCQIMSMKLLALRDDSKGTLKTDLTLATTPLSVAIKCSANDQVFSSQVPSHSARAKTHKTTAPELHAKSISNAKVWNC